MGDDRSKSDVKTSCDPVVDKDDLGFKEFVYPKSYEENSDGDDVASPCGLMARSYFNDTYTLFKKDGNSAFNIKDDDIAWSIDKD
jgi:hypothetical protein